MTIALLRYLTIFCLTGKAWCDYCEWDLCGGDQYCCGDNQCCDYVYKHWYFWVGVVFLVLLVSACGGIFRYYYYRQWNTHAHTHHAGSNTPYYPCPPHPPHQAPPVAPKISNRDPHFQVTQDCLKVEM
ncbi:hypothetical protein Pcinc_043284 [Petrolisthes cinctipes]|uniref:Vesicular, overexpressed in cancer, prosurvival protein 1 n=1 Tax=Petrolisthes cinctipes TaxID=88211 RepID=A0AAE1BGR7_PETCI|nr:hypothetical protein Pcinc_043284 [Petrolisthes cinctipes]